MGEDWSRTDSNTTDEKTEKKIAGFLLATVVFIVVLFFLRGIFGLLLALSLASFILNRSGAISTKSFMLSKTHEARGIKITKYVIVAILILLAAYFLL